MNLEYSYELDEKRWLELVMRLPKRRLWRAWIFVAALWLASAVEFIAKAIAEGSAYRTEGYFF